MKKIAIVGQIGSGKSAALQAFNNIQHTGLRVLTIKLDNVAKELKASSPNLKRDVEHKFGSEIINPETSTNFVLDTIFTDPIKYKVLNDIVSGYMYDYLLQQFSSEYYDLIVVEGANIIHSPKLMDLFDAIVELDTTAGVCRSRVQARNRYTEEQINTLQARTTIQDYDYVDYKRNSNITVYRIQSYESISFLRIQYAAERIVARVCALPADQNVMWSGGGIAEILLTNFGIVLPNISTTLHAKMVKQPYHNLNHLLSVTYNFLISRAASPTGFDLYSPKNVNVVIACLLHDFITGEPNRADKSAEYAATLLSGVLPPDRIKTVQDLIRATRYSSYFNLINSNNMYVHAMITSDLSVFQYSYDAVLEYEQAIREEHKHISDREYKHGRAMFLQETIIPIIKKHFEYQPKQREKALANIQTLLEYIDNEYPDTQPEIPMPKLETELDKYIRTKLRDGNILGEDLPFTEPLAIVPAEPTIDPNESVGVYPGSFNPLHQGHLDVVRQALRVCNKVVVLKCINGAKEQSGEDALIVSTTLPANCSYAVHLESFATYLVNNQNRKLVIIRGVRNGTDLQYENDYIAHLTQMYRRKTNGKQLPPVIYIPASDHVKHISSSSIKAIMPFDPDYANSLLVK